MAWVLLTLLVLLVAAVLLPGVSVSQFVTGYINSKPVELEVAPIDDAGHVLRSDAAASWLDMRRAAAEDGVVLTANTAFRDMAFQERLYAAWLAGTGSPAAKPGTSTHQAGLSVDVTNRPGAFAWLKARGAEFGWRDDVRSVDPKRDEPWHWTYYGRP